MRYTYPIILCAFSLFYSTLYGQEKKTPLINGEFKNLKMEQFVQQIESKTNYHFYYDPNQFDSLQINISVKDQPLQKVLELALADSTFHFAIDQYNNVFVIKNKSIRTDLPVGFFNKIRNQ